MRREKKTIIHIFGCTSFTVEYMENLYSCVSRQEHKFILYGDIDSIRRDGIEEFKGCYSHSKKKNFIYQYSRMLHSAEKIIIHGMFFEKTNMIPLLPYIKKIQIVFWGADIYFLKTRSGSIKGQILRWAYLKVVENVGAIGTLIEGDYNILCSYCHPKGKHFVVEYLRSKKRVESELAIRSVNKASDPYMILLGNSAAETGQHIEALQILERFKDENIRIIVPLSYGGSEQYKKEVMWVGNEIFHEKINYLTKMMSYNEYIELVNTCSVGIFNHNRQQAMGNILEVGTLGGIVYLRSDTPMWNEMIHNRKLRYRDILSIKEMSFKDFITITHEDAEWNKLINVSNQSIERFRKEWINFIDGR